MNAALHWFTTPEWARVVQTLLHSLWQGALIAAALTLGLRRLASPQSRYRCSLIALAAIPLAGIVTWAVFNTANHFSPAALPDPQVASETAVAPEMVALDPNAKSKIVVIAHRNVTAPPQANWTAWLALVWLVGAGLMLGRAGIKVAGAEQLRRSCRPLDHPAVMQLVVEARGAVGYARNLRVAVTDKLTSPAVVGVLVPTLVLPLTLLTTLSPEQIRFILLHELAHIRRGDYFANLFQLFTEALLFFNPAVWWISHQVRCEREACCDALAIELSGAPADYARTLVHVAENMLNPTPGDAPAFGGEREPSSLADRVQRLLVPGYRPSLRLTWRAMIAAFVLGAVLLVLSAEGTRVAVAQITKRPAQSANANSPRANEQKVEAAHLSRGSLDYFDLAPWPLDPNSRSAAALDDNASQFNQRWFRPHTKTENLALPLIALRSDGIPLLVDLPLFRNLFGSQRANSANADYLQLFQLSALSKSSRGAYDVTDSLIPRFQDTVLGADLIQFSPQNDRLTGKENQFPTDFDLGNRSGQSAPLFTREFNLDTNSFYKLMGSWPQSGGTNSIGTFARSVRKLFAESGVDLDPRAGKAFFYTVGRHTLLLRATKEELDRVESLLQSIHLESPQTTSGMSLQTNSSRLEVSGLNNNSQVEYNVADGRVVVTNGGIVRFHDVVVQADSIELEHQSGKLRATGHARIESPPGAAESSPVNSNVAANAVQTASRTNLFTRTFKVEPNTFWNDLTNVTGISPAKQNVREAVRDYFATLGVDLSPPKSVYFNDRTGEFLVRATAEDLDVIEAALQVANKYTPQVNIKVRFVEVERGETGSDWFLGASGNPSNPHSSTASATTGTTSNLGPQSVTGILTDPQYRVVLRALEQRNGYSLLSEGEVTTLSGRPAQIQVVELRTIVNGYEPGGYEPGRGALESLRKQAKEQDVAIEKAKAELAELRVKLHISDSDATGSAPQQRVSNEEYRRYIAAKYDREVSYRGRQAQLGQLKALSKTQLRDVLPGMPGLEMDPTLNELIIELNAADQKLASLGNVVSEKHPEYIRIKEQQKLLNDKIDARVEGIMKRLETQLATAKAELDSLTDSVESARNLDQAKLTDSRPYYDKKRELDDMIDFRRLLTRKINLEEIYHLPPSVPIPSLPGSTETNLANTNRFQAQTLPFGPVIDLTPTVSADGHTIQLTVIPTLTEFLGYDDPKKVLPPGDPRSNDETLPLPRVRVRRVITSANVWDGQTLVLSMGDDQFLNKQPGGAVQKGRNPDAPEKQLLVFITPTIVDPAGNRVNDDAETLPAGLHPLRK